MIAQPVLTAFVGLPVILLIGYAIGIQYQRESLPMVLRAVCAVVGVVALLLDVLANWTVLSVYMLEWPRWRADVVHAEWTFSTRLERLWFDAGWRGKVARPIARLLNRLSPPGHPHIKAAVGTH